MSLSVYVHIPYCLQRCRYCDFTTFEWTEILPPERYIGQVLQEIRGRHHLWPERGIATLYFGGGTPSLLAPELIVAVKDELANVGFRFLDGAEITIEINPATLTPAKLDTYLRAGINRFSVGAQTFDDRLLGLCGRKHSAADTRATLALLKGLNHSFDLLFALPGQSQQDLSRDLDEVREYDPPHLSAYCLTVPEGHPMSFGRPPEEAQIDMFRQIESALAGQGLRKYEISNFSRPGMESRHNLAYWLDREYWGIGLSSHSYSRPPGSMGLRFWNPKSLKTYADQVTSTGAAFPDFLPADQFERLEVHEALTDFCHMHLRTASGIGENALHQKFGHLRHVEDEVMARLQRLRTRGWIECDGSAWRLTSQGQLVSNQAFSELTFLSDDLKPGSLTRSTPDTYCSV